MDKEKKRCLNGCKGPVHAHGLCANCYHRELYTANPDVVAKRGARFDYEYRKVTNALTKASLIFAKIAPAFESDPRLLEIQERLDELIRERINGEGAIGMFGEARRGTEDRHQIRPRTDESKIKSSVRQPKVTSLPSPLSS